MKTRVSSKGQIVLPAELRQRDGISPGQEFEVERYGLRGVAVTVVPAPGASMVVTAPSRSCR